MSSIDLCDFRNLEAVQKFAEKLHGVVVQYPDANKYFVVPDEPDCRTRVQILGGIIVKAKH